MKWKKQILQLTPYKPGKPIDEVKREYGLTNIVKLASNENPFGCSEKVYEAIQNYASPFSLYPDGYATDIRGELARFFNIKPTQIIFGNGSDENIQVISRALLQPGTNTVMATPTFSQYRHNAIIEGAEVREVPLINGAHDLDGMLQAIDEMTAIVWICSPNNPTGTYTKNKELMSFLQKVPKDTLVVIDEAYCEYVVAEDYHNSIELIEEFDNVIALRTFSKIYGLASFRIGYGIAQEKIIQALEPAREPFNTNSLAQKVAIAALRDQDFVNNCRRKNREGLQQFYSYCEARGLSYYPSQGNFLFIDCEVDGDEVFQFLLERGYIVRSGKALGIPTGIRVTVGSKEQNDGFFKVMDEFLQTRK